MTSKLFALTIVGLIAALAALGLVRDRTVATTAPLPIQPFFPEVNITLGSSDLDWGPAGLR